MPEQWEIWYAKFAFEEDPTKIKKRPVLILGDNKAFPILTAKVTKSSPRPGYPGEYAIVRWKEAGLNFPSTIRLSKKCYLYQNDMLYRIGRLAPSDIIAIEQIIQN